MHSHSALIALNAVHRLCGAWRACCMLLSALECTVHCVHEAFGALQKCTVCTVYYVQHSAGTILIWDLI